MKISVVVPTFNRHDTLRRALCSVLGQSEPPFEILVVDDGSTDATQDTVKAFPTVRYFRLEGNHGAAYARNFGVGQAHGDWIAFIDSDDSWLTDKLEKQSRAAMQDPEVGLWCTGMLVHRQSGQYELHQPETGGARHPKAISELHVYPFAPSSWLIRKSFFEVLGGFDQTMPSCEDWDLLVKIASASRIAAISDPLVIKYNRADSLDADPARKLRSYGMIFERYPVQWKQDPRGRSAYLDKSAHAAIQLGDFRLAREYLSLAIRNRPLAVRRWMKWFLCLLMRQRLLIPFVLALWPSVAREVQRAKRA